MVAHDLRQPVTLISGYATLVAQQATPDTALFQKQVEHIRVSARRLNRMIADLLDASRFEARHLTLERQEIDLPLLVRAVVDRMREITTGHPVTVEISGEIPLLKADPGRLEQVLGNLLSNAAKYSDADTEIQVSVARYGVEIQVAITNQGGGISPEDLPHLFTRFYRTHATHSNRIDGLGLGLYIAKNLVEAHGGRIHVDSVPGQTTTFSFSLPLAPDSTRSFA